MLAQRAARGKRRSSGVARFLLDLDHSCAALAHDLRAGSYRPGRGRSFRIRDPKPRRIYALPFRDRVVQHLLIDATLPLIERRLVAHSYACRVDKGSHRCLQRAAALHRHHRVVLRVDIQRFFPSIDHQILRRLLQRLTPPAWRPLRDCFLTNLGLPAVAVERADFYFPGDDLFTPQQRPHGLPIGSLTSQVWANVYLAPLDALLANHLALPFVRYCDDLLIYADDEAPLRAALAALHRGAQALRLRLHPQKSRLHRTSDPVSFLGFVLRRRGRGVRVRLRHENVVRMRRRVRLLQRRFACGALQPEEVTQHLMAWLAHARHGDTRALIEQEIERWRFQLAEE